MIIKSATFLMSNQTYKKCPTPDKPEYAFIGRSNVGKSSLINMLTGYGKLAKTSAQPGKTQLINHFVINENWYLVDLPGYGFAKVSKEMRKKFEEMIHDYIIFRDNLMCMFLLIDSRIPPQNNDIEFINKLGENGIPFVILFTKADKLAVGKLATNVQTYKEELAKYWEELPQIIVTSATEQTGKEEILQFISATNATFKKE